MAAVLKPVLSALRSLVRPYLLHASGQALAWYSVATHDVSKWEAAAASGGALVLASLLKKVSAWVGA